ncbi:unnamed protein product [Urochloa decumbens]|uniref:Subtilisin-like protease n=1 Tax=Urochloa decumbens TaxID=240449 RepID=A0ABC9G2J6_9POAL
MPCHFATHGHWYTSMVATHSPRPEAADHSTRILYTYDTVMHGFAVRLTGDEARRMSGAEGVIGVYEDRPLRFLTTRSPGFLGLDPQFGAWRDTDFGDGVIIDIIDSGIWPESPSFSDSGHGPVRSSWRGKCVDADDFNASLLCNNKLVGARAFHVNGMGGGGALSPRDYYGHGTHVASTAAGSEVLDAGIDMFVRGTARGVAPKARIAMYKAVTGSDAIAANDAAVKDGVDIISGSIGFCDSPCPLYDDVLAIATFGSERAGVLAVLSAGNDGPEASTVTNAAPWVTTVGASSVDRMFPAKLRLGDGTLLIGQALYTMKANGTAMAQLVFNPCLKTTLTPDQIMGKIVVCVDEDVDTTDIALAPRAGAAGLVFVDDSSWSTDGIFAGELSLPLPCIGLSYTAGKKLRAYMASAPYPVASFIFTCETVIGENRAPMVWSWSSRGPNPVSPEVLKPDVIAPGVNILAALPGNASLTNPRKNSYKLGVGTSMACPHVSGVAALIKKKHGDWSPAMIRSALITTAATLDNTDREILDNGVVDRDGNIKAATPFAAGAGHVRPQLAMDPGLVYDASPRDYVDFLCALNYTAEQLRRFAPDMATCTRELPGGAAGLNYPSFVVIFDGRTGVHKLTRTVTKVSEEEAETYNVIVKAPEHVKVIVTPTTLEFKEPKEKKTYTVEFRNEARGIQKTEWEFGHIIWENEKLRVRSPVAFHWKN